MRVLKPVRLRLWMAAVMMVWSVRAASAQVTPAAGHTPPDDTPSIKVGAVLYTDWTYVQSPQASDADGNLIHPSQFNITRSYINITGNISHLVVFRVTPDIAREDGAGSSLKGSLTFRIKYAFAQVNLDDWMTRGSWARFGVQQTPIVDYEEGIYRYRFQGTIFSEREGFLSSSDAGASFYYSLPSNYGEVHVGLYNGETYSKAEVNDQKAVQIRGTVRPFARSVPVLRGLRLTAFYDGDNYVKYRERKRFIGQVTFEHKYVNAGVDYLNARDQTSVTKPDVEGKGYSIWATPKSPKGFEALLRYDHLTPNTLFDSQARNRTIVGIAYWFPHEGNVSAAILVDYDGRTFDNFTPAQPNERRIAVHGLVSF